MKRFLLIYYSSEYAEREGVREKEKMSLSSFRFLMTVQLEKVVGVSAEFLEIEGTVRQIS